jgi:hypothetical protein
MPEFQADSKYAQAYHIFHQRHHRTAYGKFDESLGEMNLATYNLTGYLLVSHSRVNDLCLDMFIRQQIRRLSG